uniref:Uncharacterized protein n=1 Tax=Glossina pallidipes TaxID=7398 RepID=A0A1A9ZJV2_GLOPL
MVTVLKNSLKIEELEYPFSAPDSAQSGPRAQDDFTEHSALKTPPSEKMMCGKMSNYYILLVNDCPWEKSRYFILHIFCHLVKYAYKILILLKSRLDNLILIQSLRCSVAVSDVRRDINTITHTSHWQTQMSSEAVSSYAVGENTTNCSVQLN